MKLKEYMKIRKDCIKLVNTLNQAYVLTEILDRYEENNKQDVVISYKEWGQLTGMPRATTYRALCYLRDKKFIRPYTKHIEEGKLRLHLKVLADNIGL